jgi:hypothetical protein
MKPVKNKNIIFCLTLIIFFLILLNVFPAVAANNLSSWQTILKNTAEKTGGIYVTEQAAGESTTLTIAKYIGVVLNLALFFGTILMIRVIWAGYLWMTARGNTERVEEAKKILRHAAIGVIILVALYIIAYFVMSRLIYISGYKGRGF